MHCCLRKFEQSEILKKIYNFQWHDLSKNRYRIVSASFLANSQLAKTLILNKIIRSD